MQYILFLIIGVLGALVVILFVLLARKKQQPHEEDQSFVLLQQQMNEINRQLEERMHESAKTIERVNERLVRLDETNKQVMGFADQLQHLQDILKNPKQRGTLGEYYLETVLQNVLPSNAYEMQYKFKNGEIVDAIIKVRDSKIIPIDSKFSLENYNRLIQSKDKQERERLEKELRNDLKKRIDETSKYIRPDEHTLEFAFMFIPSEALFYDLLINEVGSVTGRDLVEYATRDKRVIIVSPTTFLAFLQTVLQGLKELHIEEQAQDIKKNVHALMKHVEAYSIYIQKLGNNLSTTVRSFEAVSKEFQKIGKDINRITDTDQKLEIAIDSVELPEEEL